MASSTKSGAWTDTYGYSQTHTLRWCARIAASDARGSAKRSGSHSKLKRVSTFHAARPSSVSTSHGMRRSRSVCATATASSGVL